MNGDDYLVVFFPHPVEQKSYHHSWEFEGASAIPPLSPGNKALILRPYCGIMVVDNPLIRPAIFLGKTWHWGKRGPLRFPNEMMI